MGSASREALAVSKRSLGGPLSPSTGADLLAASAQIAGAPALLSALADAAAPVAAKTGLVERLFGGISAGARSVLTVAVEQSWSNPAEFVDGIEELGLRAESIAQTGLDEELLAAAAVVDANHDLELSLGSKLGDPAAKAELARRVFDGKISDAALGVVIHLVTNPRGRRVSPALREGARLAADQGGSELATVTVAAPLSAEQQAKLAVLLEQSAGRQVRVTTVVDPALVGGVRIQIGDEVIDGSVRSRIDDLRLQLAG